MYNFTTKLEVNIRRGRTVATDYHNLSGFLIKNRIPTLVVDSEFIEPVLIERSRFGGSYKVITTIDFDHNGKNYALAKMNYLPRSTFSTDGIEVLLTPNRTDKESLNELKAITEWARQINPLMEIRWVFEYRIRKYDAFNNFMPYLKHWPANFIRTDTNLESPNLNISDHLSDINHIREYCSIPIKVSGNVDLEMVETLPKVARFDVSVVQAKRIVKELQARMVAPVVPVKKPELKEEVVKSGEKK